MRFVQCLLLILLCPVAAQAQVVSDRPDAADGPNILPRGVFQIETGLASERDSARERTRSTPTLLRYGAFDTVELRLETDGRISAPTARGYGDVAIGAKWQLQDGEKGEPALALIGQLEMATGSRALRGQGNRPSLLLATEWELSPAWSLTVTPGVIRDRND